MRDSSHQINSQQSTNVAVRARITPRLGILVGLVGAVLAMGIFSGCGSSGNASVSVSTVTETQPAAVPAASAAKRFPDQKVKMAFVDCMKNLPGWAWQSAPPTKRAPDAPKQTFQATVTVGNDVTERIGTAVWKAQPSAWLDYYIAPSPAAAVLAREKLVCLDGRCGSYFTSPESPFISEIALPVRRTSYDSNHLPADFSMDVVGKCELKALGH